VSHANPANPANRIGVLESPGRRDYSTSIVVVVCASTSLPNTGQSAVLAQSISYSRELGNDNFLASV
jgi:hypothetical protein